MCKKPLVFTALAFYALIVYSCTLPSAVEIKANPKTNIAATKSISDLFPIDDLQSGFDSTKIDIYDCTNVNRPKTFLLIIKQNNVSIKNDINIGSKITPGVPAGTSVNITIENYQTPQINLAGMNTPLDFLSGFDCDSIQGEVVVSGKGQAAKDFARLFDIKLSSDSAGNDVLNDINNRRVREVQDGNVPPENRYGLDNIAKTTSLHKLPGKGILFDATKFFKNRGTPLELTYAITLNDTLTQAMVDGLQNSGDNLDISFEILIWLPMQFKANPSPAAYAELTIPDLFDKDKDIFGRDPGEKNEMIESLRNVRFFMKMNDYLFADYAAEMSIGLSTWAPLRGNELVIVLTNQDMAYLNANIFKPAMCIRFKSGKILTIPRNLKMDIIGFDAEVVYRINL